MNSIMKSNENFVFPQFLQSGRFSYIVEYNSKFYFHKAVIHFREEQIPLTVKDTTTSFTKSDSVFTNWKEDIIPIV